MKVVISDDGRFARFRLAPLEALLALKRNLEVPVDRITSAGAMPRADVSFGPIIRAPGTYVPGLVRFGSYGRKPNRHFWAVFRQDPVLVVDCENWDYARLVVGVKDAAHSAGALHLAMS